MYCLKGSGIKKGNRLPVFVAGGGCHDECEDQGVRGRVLFWVKVI